MSIVLTGSAITSCEIGQKKWCGNVSVGNAAASSDRSSGGVLIRSIMTLTSWTVLMTRRTARSFPRASSSCTANAASRVKTTFTRRLITGSVKSSSSAAAEKACSISAFASGRYGHHHASLRAIRLPCFSGTPRHHCHTTTGTSHAPDCRSRPDHGWNVPATLVSKPPSSRLSAGSSSSKRNSDSDSEVAMRHSPCTCLLKMTTRSGSSGCLTCLFTLR